MFQSVLKAEYIKLNVTQNFLFLTDIACGFYYYYVPVHEVLTTV